MYMYTCTLNIFTCPPSSYLRSTQKDTQRFPNTRLRKPCIRRCKNMYLHIYFYLRERWRACIGSRETDGKAGRDGGVWMLTANVWTTLTTHAATLPHASFNKLLAGWRTLNAHGAWGQPRLATPRRQLHEALVRASLGSPVARASSWPRGRQPPTTPQPWATAGMPSRRRCSHRRR